MIISLTQMSVSAGALILIAALLRAVFLNRLPKAAFLALWGIALFRLLVPVAVPLRVGSAVSEGTAFAASAAVSQGSGFGLYDVWFAGALAAAVFFAAIYIYSCNRLRFAVLVRGNDFIDRWVAEHKLPVMQSDRVAGPLAAGLVRARIILPLGMDMSNTQLLRHVLTHEYYHIRRFDALWKVLMVCALCIHWWNPAVWLMFVLANRDLELTCDELTLRRLGTETKAAYAYSIIGMAESRRNFTALVYNGFSKNGTVERIESIMKISKKSVASLALAFVLVAALGVGTLSVLAAGSYNEITTTVTVTEVTEDGVTFAREGTAEETALVQRSFQVVIDALNLEEIPDGVTFTTLYEEGITLVRVGMDEDNVQMFIASEDGFDLGSLDFSHDGVYLTVREFSGSEE